MLGVMARDEEELLKSARYSTVSRPKFHSAAENYTGNDVIYEEIFISSPAEMRLNDIWKGKVIF